LGHGGSSVRRLREKNGTTIPVLRDDLLKKVRRRPGR
jgi:hypothetical protein